MKVEYELEKIWVIKNLSWHYHALFDSSQQTLLSLCLHSITGSFKRTNVFPWKLPLFQIPFFPMHTERNRTLSNHSVIIVSRCCFYCMDILVEQFGEKLWNGSLWCNLVHKIHTFTMFLTWRVCSRLDNMWDEILRNKPKNAFQKHYLWSRTKRPISLLGITHSLSLCVRVLHCSL